MNNRITYTQIIQRLEAVKQPYGLLPLHTDISIIITQYGGRVFGPFLSQEAKSIYWMNAAWADQDSFETYLQSGEWNIGGERIWIAPELQYAVRDRTNFGGSYALPPQMDPGTYTLDEPRHGQWRLRQQMTMDAYNLATGRKTLDLEILVQRVEDPLRGLSAYAQLLDGITYAGYEQIVTLAEHTHDDILSESWNLIQLNPGGQLIIPASPHLETTDYNRGPVPKEAHTVRGNHVRFHITGKNMFKVGYKSAHVTGRAAYLNTLDDDRAYLLIRSFTNNPSSVYIEEPDNQPGVMGDSVHVFNDDGSYGGFGEIECQGQTIGGTTGKSSSTDQFILWMYVGAVDKLKSIVTHLLGVTL
jgi:hypothetical protein